MTGMTLYEFLLLAHVLGVVAWFGASLTMFLLWRRAVSSGNSSDVVAQAESAMWVDRRLTIPASLVVLLAGGWLMSEGNWGMDQGWLHVGMTGVFLGAGISLLWTGRLQRRLVSGTAAGGTVSRITFGMLATMGVVLFAFWAMVAKPWG